MVQWWGFNVQNQLHSWLQGLDGLNDWILFFEVGIATLVGGGLLACLTNSYFSYHILDWPFLEGLWTVLPSGVLLALGIPSLQLLYATEEHTWDPVLSVKVMGHQWYWTYSIPELGLNWDSYLHPWEKESDFKNLESDGVLVLPFLAPIRILVGASDVLHSWTLPNLGVKADAVPGRLNSLNVMSTTPLLSFGQCSEICGAQHSFMPISVEFTSPSLFNAWVSTQLD